MNGELWFSMSKVSIRFCYLMEELGWEPHYQGDKVCFR